MTGRRQASIRVVKDEDLDYLADAMASRLKGDGGGNSFDGMEERVIKLEKDVGDIKAGLARLEPAISKMTFEVGEVKGKLSQMPTSYQLVLGGVGLIVAIFGAAFALLRLALPH